MFLVLLKFGQQKDKAPEWMDAHNQWIQKGFDDQVFAVVGSLQPQMGGAILAYNTSLDALQQRVNEDPFVKQQIVSAEIMEITPAKTIDEMNFLMPTA